MRLYGRQFELQAGTPDSQGKAWSDLRVSFDVTHTQTSEPNKAQITVYNLHRGALSYFQSDDTVVRLLAGYDQPALIFAGEPMSGGVTQKREGVDRVLEIEAQDGGRELRQKRVNLSLATEATMQGVADRMARKLGLAAAQTDLPEDVTLKQGVHAQGPVRDVLDRVTRSTGARWSIQDRTLTIYERGGEAGRRAAVFSSENGNLIGTPKEKDSGVSVKALLEPSLRPNLRFRLESRELSGLYRASEVKFSGDTHGSDWYVETTAEEA